MFLKHHPKIKFFFGNDCLNDRNDLFQHMNQLTGGAHMLHRISFLKEIPMENKMQTFYRREKKTKKNPYINNVLELVQ